MKKYLPDYAFLFLLAGAIILVDQLTKAWIRSTLSMGEIWMPYQWWTAYFRIVHWKNTGAAFGMFQNANPVFMTLSSLVSLAIILYFPQVPRSERIVRLAMAMLLGGAVGNLIDRFTVGHVTDFISVGDFPVFNVADASISTGVAVLFIGMWMDERARARQAAGAPAEPADAPLVEPAPPAELSAPPEPSALAADRAGSEAPQAGEK
ncbi:MAG: signal peptidase II [Chloroflexota bacterium]